MIAFDELPFLQMYQTLCPLCRARIVRDQDDRLLQ